MIFIECLKTNSVDLRHVRFICKEIIKVAFEKIMLLENQFTQDLYLCYSTFIKYHPHLKREMQIILKGYLNPDDNREKLFATIDFIGTFLLSYNNKVSEMLIQKQLKY